MCDVDLNGILVLRGDVPSRGHRYKIVQKHCANNYRKNFFVQRVAPIWNSLPPSIVDFNHSLDLNVRCKMSILVFFLFFNLWPPYAIGQAMYIFILWFLLLYDRPRPM